MQALFGFSFIVASRYILVPASLALLLFLTIPSLTLTIYSSIPLLDEPLYPPLAAHSSRPFPNLFPYLKGRL
jgi:hypothetical protein